jgi:hypothetical protein
MAKNPHSIASEDEVEQLSLDELNTLIAQKLWGWEHGGTSQGRRAFFKRLVWLEAQRERLFGIPAAKRRYNRS